MPPEGERITSLQNPRLKRLLALRDRRERDELGLTLIEEARVVRRALAAGYPLHEPGGITRTLDELDKLVGLERLGCLHLNDSLAAHGSHRDRHARLGQGELGEARFAELLADRRLHGIPKMLEVPGGDQAFVDDLRLLARLARRTVK